MAKSLRNSSTSLKSAPWWKMRAATNEEGAQRQRRRTRRGAERQRQPAAEFERNDRRQQPRLDAELRHVRLDVGVTADLTPAFENKEVGGEQPRRQRRGVAERGDAGEASGERLQSCLHQSRASQQNSV